MRYRRADVAGGTYFFTVNLVERKRTLLVDHVDVPRNVLREIKARHPFHIEAMVILPGHLLAFRRMTGTSGGANPVTVAGDDSDETSSLRDGLELKIAGIIKFN